MNVLFINESNRDCWQLGRHLENLGCHYWCASTSAEIRALFGQREFHVVLSAHPITERTPLMELLKGSEIVFYSVPVEDSCLWFQAVPELSNKSRVSALRPREFRSMLENLIARG
jgi:hypothetical protein